ncbi:hypothetical protein, partial [Megamonas sp.]|uniref:hypothetical protein n=1 Tax=Megamonas sp. TaxID=2049033 RepID=UPI00258D7C87
VLLQYRNHLTHPKYWSISLLSLQKSPYYKIIKVFISILRKILKLINNNLAKKEDFYFNYKDE